MLFGLKKNHFTELWAIKHYLVVYWILVCSEKHSWLVISSRYSRLLFYRQLPKITIISIPVSAAWALMCKYNSHDLAECSEYIICFKNRSLLISQCFFRFSYLLHSVWLQSAKKWTKYLIDTILEEANFIKNNFPLE